MQPMGTESAERKGPSETTGTGLAQLTIHSFIVKIRRTRFGSSPRLLGFAVLDNN